MKHIWDKLWEKSIVLFHFVWVLLLQTATVAVFEHLIKRQINSDVPMWPIYELIGGIANRLEYENDIRTSGIRLEREGIENIRISYICAIFLYYTVEVSFALNTWNNLSWSSMLLFVYVALLKIGWSRLWMGMYANIIYSLVESCKFILRASKIISKRMNVSFGNPSLATYETVDIIQSSE